MIPLLRWPGGKRRLLPYIIPQIGKLPDNGRYIELFAGGAAVFFDLQPQRGVLVDICKPLISFYEAIAREPVAFCNEIDALLRLPFCEKTYLAVREDWNGHDFGVKFAAKMMYMNKLAFNGLFRLNKDLKFNVPWGDKPKTPEFPTVAEITAYAELLRRAALHNKDYNHILKSAHEGDCVYADPPYVDTFDGYSGTGSFTLKHHQELADGLKRAAARGVLVVASNVDCPQVRAMYGDWSDIIELKLLHSIGAAAESRKTVNEVLIVARGVIKDPKQLELAIDQAI